MRYNEMYSKYVFNHYLIFILYFSRRPANKSQGIKRKFHKIFTKEK